MIGALVFIIAFPFAGLAGTYYGVAKPLGLVDAPKPLAFGRDGEASVYELSEEEIAAVYANAEELDNQSDFGTANDEVIHD